MHWAANSNFVDRDRIPQYVVGFGALLTLALLGEVAFLFVVGSPIVFDGGFLVGVVTTIPFLAGIVFGGYWLRSSDLSPDRYLRVVGWGLTGAVVFLAINLALIVALPYDSWLVVGPWIRWAVVLGASVGLLIGCLEGRAIERALTAERASLQAAYLEDQREYLDYLNSILRHEVLNTSTVINGYASLLEAEATGLTEQQREWARIVIDESEELSTVIDDVRVLLQATEGPNRLEPVNAARVLEAELSKLDRRFESVDVATSIPDTAFVRADDLLARIFANLLSNAVEHNDAETPAVAVTVDTMSETVRIEIADNGPGIPDSEQETLFERVESRGSTHGLGLYLVSQLATRYGGSVELTETGHDGSVFTVELPALSDDQAEVALERQTDRSLVME
ncbi:ATP-binding protein [Natronorubrum texcoconense]|uniref:Signal transduction histidine kinase n=1 Tax=Natronorubrum texcoconense TaxID=1095776 RepID=A0A1G9BBE1_9EURY|nr:ATP-binding protein [Natronorubrum texcoconense]SDK36892.1 Signal transduction histidine kinase [Natronorubrum texcoconense]